MKVILKQNVESLGKAGDLVKVADGYARNFWFPRGSPQKRTAGISRPLSMKRIAFCSRRRRFRNRPKKRRPD